MVNPIKRFYCNKVLPLTYDDSLSYYEQLCKLTHKMNEIIENINNNFQKMVEDTIKENIERFLINAMYISETETIVISLDEISTEQDRHTYTISDSSMTIGE